jgi:hypothetical protein
MALTLDTSTDLLESRHPLFHDSKTEKNWRNYLTYQETFQERIDVLQTHDRETPKEDDGDRIMPALLKKWTGGKTANQPTSNYSDKMSCSFNASRTDAFEKASKFFQMYLRSSIKNGAASIAKLLIGEIAYLKSWEVEWKQQAGALAGILLSFQAPRLFV